MSALDIAIIGVPGAWSSEHLKQSLEQHPNVLATVISVDALEYRVAENEVYYQQRALSSYSAVVIKKLGAYEPKILDWLDVLSNIAPKVPFYSHPAKLRKMISRVGCTLGLAASQVAMPKTCITEDVKEAQAWIAEQQTVVFKPNFSTKARGMEVLKKDEVSTAHLEALKKQFGVLYLQEKMELPGKDLGVVFLGKKYLGTYARVAAKDSWNTTTKDGGHYGAFEPSEAVLALAQKARDAFNLDFCCVDVAETPKGHIVFEVSAFGGFSGLLKGAGIDTAAALSQQIITDLRS